MTATAAPASARRHAVFHELRVAAVEPLTEDSVSITFLVPEHLREEYTFTAGQHLTLRCAAAGDEERRSYSICTPEGGPLTVAVKRLPGGVFSAHAHTMLRAGDTMEVMTPAGRFGIPVDPTGARSMVAVAAGSGITPVLSIVSTMLAAEPRSRFTVVYGNRCSRSIMFLEELEDLKNRYPDRLALHHVLSREEQPVDLFSGRIDAERLGRLLDVLIPPDAVDEWFLCGPAAMVREARATLLGRGAEARHIHTELFHAEGDGVTPIRAATEPAGGAGTAAVTVVLDGRSTSFSMPRSGKVLDAALRVRDDAPFACRGGVCGTCRARLVSGEVQMDRHWALEDSEVEDGYILACQSHPASDALVLDFDG